MYNRIAETEVKGEREREIDLLSLSLNVGFQSRNMTETGTLIRTTKNNTQQRAAGLAVGTVMLGRGVVVIVYALYHKKYEQRMTATGDHGEPPCCRAREGIGLSQ